MASTNFIDNQTVIYAAWLNDVNNAVYNGIFVSPSVTATNFICNGTASGAGFTALINNTLASPAAIGNVTPNTGAFTSLTLTTPLAKASGGTGTTASTGTGSNVFATAPTINNIVLTGTVSDGTYAPPASTVVGGAAKAWVNFGSDGTMRNSLNVSSVVVLGTGWYRINFTTAFSNNLYAMAGMCSNNGSFAGVMCLYTNGGGGQTTAYMDVAIVNASNQALNSFPTNSAVVFAFN